MADIFRPTKPRSIGEPLQPATTQPEATAPEPVAPMVRPISSTYSPAAPAAPAPQPAAAVTPVPPTAPAPSLAMPSPQQAQQTPPTRFSNPAAPKSASIRTPDYNADKLAAGYFDAVATQTRATEKAAAEAQEAEQKAAIDGQNFATAKRAARENRETLINPATGLKEFVESDEEYTAKQAEKAATEEAKALQGKKNDRLIKRFKAANREYFTDSDGNVRPVEGRKAYEAAQAKKQSEQDTRLAKLDTETELATRQAEYQIDRDTRPIAAKPEELQSAASAAVEDAVYTAMSAKGLDKAAKARLSAIADKAAASGQPLRASELPEDLAELIAKQAPDQWSNAQARAAELATDEENRRWRAEQETELEKLRLKAVNPKRWEARYGDKTATESEGETAPGKPAPADNLVETVPLPEREASYQERAGLYAERVRQVNERQAAQVRQWDNLLAENDGLVSTGVTADDLVPMTIGDEERLIHKSLVPRLQKFVAQYQARSERESETFAGLDAEATELRKEAELLEVERDRAAREQKAEFSRYVDRLAQEPDLAPVAAMYRDADADFEARRAALAEDFTLTPQQRQVAELALIEDRKATFAAASEQIEAANVGRRKRAEGNARIIEAVESADAIDADTLMAGTTPEQRAKIYERQRDIIAGIAQESGMTVTEAARAARSYQEAKFSWLPGENARTLSNGTIAVNPLILWDDEAYSKAVTEAKGDPEAKTAALEKQAELKRAIAPQIVAGLRKLGGFEKWEARQLELPADQRPRTEADLVARYYAERGGFREFSDNAALIARQGGNDIAAQFFGFGATIGLHPWLPQGWRDRSRAVIEDLGDRETGTFNAANAQMTEALNAAQVPQLVQDVGRAAVSMAPALLSGGVGVGAKAVTTGLLVQGSRLGNVGRITLGAMGRGGFSQIGAKEAARMATQAGLGGAGAGAFMQTFGSTYPEAVAAYQESGMDFDEAANAALLPAAGSGVFTAAVTMAFGKTGVEALLRGRRMGEVTAGDLAVFLAKPGNRTKWLRTVRGKEFNTMAASLAGSVGKDVMGEATEEGLDSLTSALIRLGTYEQDPDRTVADAVGEGLHGALIGAFLGAAGSGVRMASEDGRKVISSLVAKREAERAAQAPAAPSPILDPAQPQQPTYTAPETPQQTSGTPPTPPAPRTLPEQVALSDAEIDSYVAPANESTPRVQEEARLMRRVAMGEAEQLSATELGILGLARGKTGKIGPRPLSKLEQEYATAPVAAMEGDNVVLTAEGLDRLAANFPRTRDLVKMNEPEARAFFREKAAEAKGPAAKATPAEAPAPTIDDELEAAGFPSGEPIIPTPPVLTEEQSRAERITNLATWATNERGLDKATAQRLATAHVGRVGVTDPDWFIQALNDFGPAINAEVSKAAEARRAKEAPAPVQAEQTPEPTLSDPTPDPVESVDASAAEAAPETETEEEPAPSTPETLNPSIPSEIETTTAQGELSEAVTAKLEEHRATLDTMAAAGARLIVAKNQSDAEMMLGTQIEARVSFVHIAQKDGEPVAIFMGNKLTAANRIPPAALDTALATLRKLTSEPAPAPAKREVPTPQPKPAPKAEPKPATQAPREVPTPRTAVETLKDAFDKVQTRFASLGIEGLTEADPDNPNNNRAIWADLRAGTIVYNPVFIEKWYGNRPNAAAELEQTTKHEFWHQAGAQALIAKLGSLRAADQLMARIWTEFAGIHTEFAEKVANAYPDINFTENPNIGGWELWRMVLEFRNDNQTTEMVVNPHDVELRQMFQRHFAEQGGFRVYRALMTALEALRDFLNGLPGVNRELRDLAKAAESLVKDRVVVFDRAARAGKLAPGQVWENMITGKRYEIEDITDGTVYGTLVDASARTHKTSLGPEKLFAKVFEPITALRRASRKRKSGVDYDHDNTPTLNMLRGEFRIRSKAFYNGKRLAIANKRKKGLPLNMAEQKTKDMLAYYDDIPPASSYPANLQPYLSSIFSLEGEEITTVVDALANRGAIDDAYANSLGAKIDEEMKLLEKLVIPIPANTPKWQRRELEARREMEAAGEMDWFRMVESQVLYDFERHAMEAYDEAGKPLGRTEAGKKIDQLLGRRGLDLREGDQIIVDKETLMVSRVAPDGTATLSNGYEPSRFYETILTVEPGAIIYVFEHRDADGNVVDAMAREKARVSELGAANPNFDRSVELERKFAAGTITQPELRELEALRDEFGQGSLLQPDMFTDPATVAREREAMLNRMKIRARQERRLVAGDLVTQEDIFIDTRNEESGQGLLFAGRPRNPNEQFFDFGLSGDLSNNPNQLAFSFTEPAPPAATLPEPVVDPAETPADFPTADGDLFSQPARRREITTDGPTGTGESLSLDDSPATPRARAIEDFGEKIGGAKKDLWANFKDRVVAGLPDDIREITLGKHWPEPDYGRLIAEGANEADVAAMKALRDLVPRKPGSPWKLRRWGEMVKALHQLLTRYVVGDSGISDERFAEIVLGFPQINRKITLYQTLGFPRFLEAKEYTIDAGTYTVFAGQKYPRGQHVAVATHKGRTLYELYSANDIHGDAYAEVAQMISDRIDAETLSREATGPQKRETKFSVYQNRYSDELYIGKKTGSKVDRIKGGFETVKAAYAYIKENRAELEDIWAGINTAIRERNDENEPRTGPQDRRTSVTPEQFMEAFGFRGVEFGNWVEDTRRQADLDRAYDALIDLSRAIGVPTQALSLDGSLGLAFGARGRSKAAAHYEADYVVINLTKKAGPGSLAHEWFHAVDNYFARLENTGSTAAQLERQFATDVARMKYGALPNNVRPEVWKAIEGIRDAVSTGTFASRSLMLDERKSKPYFATTIEKAARAFEVYVKDRLRNLYDTRNDYLVNVWQGTNDSPYPTDGEMAAGITQAYDQFLEEIDTRPGERGTMLFAGNPNQRSFDFGTTGTLGGKNEIDLDFSDGSRQIVTNGSKPTSKSSAPDGSDDLMQWAEIQAAKHPTAAAAVLDGNPTDASNDGARAREVEREALEALVRIANSGLTSESDADALRSGFKDSRRVANIIPELVEETTSWNIVGAKVTTPQEFFALNAVLRNPFFESVRVAVLDSDSRVVHAEVLNIGTINESIVDLARIARMLAITRAKGVTAPQVVMSHNHPGGNPTPSDADWQVQLQLEDLVKSLGGTVLDHVITNGTKGYSLKGDYEFTMPAASQVPWVHVERTAMPAITSPDQIQAIAKSLRAMNPAARYVVMLSNQMQIIGIEHLPEVTNADEVSAAMTMSAATVGANKVILLEPKVSPGMYKVAAALRLARISLVDAVNIQPDGDIYSAREEGLLEQGLEYGITPTSPSLPTLPLADGRVLQGPGEFTLFAPLPPAYHGTPHKVDKFSLDKIGTGEGAQAYGWGLYFAQDEKVARGYRDGLSQRKVRYSGKFGSDEFPLSGDVNIVHETPKAVFGIANQIRNQMNAGKEFSLALVEEIIASRKAQLDRDIKEKEDGLRQYEATGASDLIVQNGNTSPLQNAIGFLKEARTNLNSVSPEEFSYETGNLYTVRVLADDETLLDWDRPLSEQSEIVKSVLESLDFTLPATRSWAVEKKDDFSNALIRGVANGQYVVVQRDDQGFFIGWGGRGFANEEEAQANAAARNAIPKSENPLARSIYSRLADSETPMPTTPDGNGWGSLENAHQGPRKASERLLSSGIKGIRYLDGNSRGDGDGTYNYVIFDEADIEIIAENGQPVTMATALGAANPSIPQSLNPSTPSNPAPLLSAISSLPPQPRAFVESLLTGQDVATAAQTAGYTTTDPATLAAGIGRRLLERLKRQGVSAEDARGMVEASVQVGAANPNSARDAEYLELAKDPERNREELQRLVDKAARASGYGVGPVFHGTSGAPFNVFDVRRTPITDDGYMGAGAYFHELKNQGDSYADISSDETGLPPRTMRAFIKVTTPVEIGTPPDFDGGTYGMTRAEVIEWTNRKMNQGHDGATNRFGEWVVFSSNQIKSADPITYDESGNVIPLSQRFNPASDSILFASNPEPLNPSTPSSGAPRQPGETLLDRAANSVTAAIASSDTVTGLKNTLSAQYAKPFAKPVRRAVDFVLKQAIPMQRLPHEAAALMNEMAIKQAFAQQTAMDVIRSLGGKSRFSDLAWPAQYANDKGIRKRLFLAMQGKVAMSTLPPEIQAIGTALRQRLRTTALDAVRQGRMHPDTFADMEETYMPHYYYEAEQAAAGNLFARLKLGLGDIMAQRSTMWRIEDMETKDPFTGEDGALITWDDKGKKVRFRSEEHRDAYYTDFLRERTAAEIKRRGKAKGFSDATRDQISRLTAADLNRPDKLTDELRGYAKRVEQEMRTRYRKGDPLTDEQQEKAGLIYDPVYAIAKHIASMEHDNAIAEFFNAIEKLPGYIGGEGTEGYVTLPDNRKLGRLAGRSVRADVAEEITALVNAPSDLARFYDGALALWKTGKTVYNPGTHVRNVLGNVLFAQMAGVNPLTHPQYYREAFRIVTKGGPILEELYKEGVLGGDFLSAELRQDLAEMLPEMVTEPTDDVWLKISATVDRIAHRSGAVAAKRLIEGAYQMEDELFKVASYLRAKESGMTPAEAAAHTRKWFPYYDHIGTSSAIRALRRGPMPFFSFQREAIRILGNAARERPASLAVALAAPAILSSLTASLILGLDDEDFEEIKKTALRGKGRWFARETPLFSILLPNRSKEGRLQQFDLTNVMPFASLLGTRMEIDNGTPVWQQWALEMITGSPITGIPLEMAFNTDTFRNKPIWEANMTDGEKKRAAAAYVWAQLVPPLAPGGTNWNMAAQAGTRQSNRSLERRNAAQSWIRSVVGIDVRNASPNLYAMAEQFREDRGLEQPDFAGYGTTPQSRARSRIFAELVQDAPDMEALAKDLAYLKREGKPIATEQDLNRLLFYRNPIMVIDGKDEQRQFRNSLSPEARAVLAEAETEFARIQRTAGPILRRASVRAQQIIREEAE